MAGEMGRRQTPRPPRPRRPDNGRDPERKLNFQVLFRFIFRHKSLIFRQSGHFFRFPRDIFSDIFTTEARRHGVGEGGAVQLVRNSWDRFFIVSKRVRACLKRVKCGANWPSLRSAHCSGVPQGGTAKFLLCRRAYTILPFFSSCGEVRIRFRTPAFAQSG